MLLNTASTSPQHPDPTPKDEASSSCSSTRFDHNRTAHTQSISRRSALRIVLGASAAALLAGLAGTVNPYIAQAETTQQRLDAAQMDYDQAQASLEQIGKEYQDLANQLAETQQKVADVNDQILRKQEEIDSKQAEIVLTQERINARRAALGKRMNSAYKSGSLSSLDLLLSSTSFEELTSNVYYLDKISEADRNMIEEVTALKQQLESQEAELKQQQSELQAQKADLVELQTQQQEQLNQAEAKQAEAQKLVESLNDEVKALMAQRDEELLAAQEQARQAEEERKRMQQSYGTSTGAVSVPVVQGASGTLAAVLSATSTTASPGAGWCAAWVTNVFRAAGVGAFSGNAVDLFYWYCNTAVENIQPGMIIAVPTTNDSLAGRLYGHVGIYVGNNTVRENIGPITSTPLNSWLARYQGVAPVRCGWLGGVALS